MTHVVLFHHAQGLTPGVVALADRLRAAGHEVTAPDLYEGAVFATLDEGIAHAQEIGFDTVRERGGRAVEGLPAGLVFLGLSLGLVAAQQQAQTRPGALGAVLLHGCVPASEFGGWPSGLPVQIHTREGDPYGDAAEAREFAAEVEGAELFLYPGDDHLFTDASLPAHDAAATDLVVERVLGFLARI